MSRMERWSIHYEKTIKDFESEISCSKALGLNEKTIRNGLKGKHKNKEGYTFKEVV